MNVHAFEHVPFEGLAGIESWLLNRGHVISRTRFWSKDPLPEVDALDWLIVMGGPMGIHDESAHPWLRTEMRFIEEAISRKKKILGICLGAQLLAGVLGARVYPHKNREIGWYPVTLTADGVNSRWFQSIPPKSFVPFHWHGDTFDLPSGSVHLARSEACDNQAFSLGENILALQFHVDSTRDSITQLLRYSSADLVPGPYVQSASDIENPAPDTLSRLSLGLASILQPFEKRGEGL